MNGAAVNEPEPAGNAGAARGGTNPRLFFTTLYGLTLDKRTQWQAWQSEGAARPELKNKRGPKNYKNSLADSV